MGGQAVLLYLNEEGGAGPVSGRRRVRVTGQQESPHASCSEECRSRTLAVSTAVFGGAAIASADAGASGAAVGSPGMLSGNLIQVPVHIPVNACGNSVSVIGLTASSSRSDRTAASCSVSCASRSSSSARRAVIRSSSSGSSMLWIVGGRRTATGTNPEDAAEFVGIALPRQVGRSLRCPRRSDGQDIAHCDRDGSG